MRRELIAVALAAGLLAGACGGGGDEDRLPREEYTQRMTELGERAGGSYGLFEAKSGPDVRRAVARMREAQTRSADELDRMAPPEDAERAHELLIEGERGLAADLARLEQRVGRDPLEIVVVSRAIERSPSSEKIRRAVEELRRKGFIRSAA